MMNLVELGTAIWFEHGNRIILSQHMVQFPFWEWTDSNASMHSIIGGGKGKAYVLDQKKNWLIHKNIKK